MKKTIVALLIMMGLMITGCSREEPVEKHTRILCYGDSNTYGYNPYTSLRYEEDRIWTNILNDRLGEDYTVINAGMNGRTTAYDVFGSFLVNGMNSLDECLRENVPLDMVIFMLGTNDCNAMLHLSAEDIGIGMEKLIIETKDKTIEYQGYVPEIMVIVPGAIKDNIEGSVFANDFDREAIEKSRELSSVYRKLSDKHDCLYLDASDRVDVSDVDCIHLSENGHEQLSELVYGMIVDGGNYDKD